MSRTIHVGAMPAALTNLVAEKTTGTAAAGGMSFLDIALRETAKKEHADTGFQRDQMNLGQYKQYISGRISAIPVNPTRALESLSVKISDAGFQAMKDDPEYEEWVLATLENIWSTPVFGNLGSYNTYCIGADRESFRVQSIDLDKEKELMELLDKMNGSNTDETFWERRHRQHEEYMELAQHEAMLRKLRSGTMTAAELLLGGLV